MKTVLLENPPWKLASRASAMLWALCLLAGDAAADTLGDLAKPQEGRSMRVGSTMRKGENRRGGGERKLDPKADPKGDAGAATGTTSRWTPEPRMC